MLPRPIILRDNIPNKITRRLNPRIISSRTHFSKLSARTYQTPHESRICSILNLTSSTLCLCASVVTCRVHPVATTLPTS
jgi:hypothetical protein